MFYRLAPFAACALLVILAVGGFTLVAHALLTGAASQ